jgi:hypothetical protein
VATIALAASLAGAAGSLLVRACHGRNARPLQVQVLNGSGTPELAQHAADALRARSLDVVGIGNADARTYPETLVLLRRGNPGTAREVRDALGLGRILEQRDASLLVDVTVILGSDYAARRDGR